MENEYDNEEMLEKVENTLQENTEPAEEQKKEPVGKLVGSFVLFVIGILFPISGMVLFADASSSLSAVEPNAENSIGLLLSTMLFMYAMAVYMMAMLALTSIFCLMGLIKAIVCIKKSSGIAFRILAIISSVINGVVLAFALVYAISGFVMLH
ncbi:MAG: hypothetical protein J6A83_05205 [Clostridia bacterium]|nr:hypothetical protein [Clostridia bacterium]